MLGLVFVVHPYRSHNIHARPRHAMTATTPGGQEILQEVTGAG